MNAKRIYRLMFMYNCGLYKLKTIDGKKMLTSSYGAWRYSIDDDYWSNSILALAAGKTTMFTI